MSDFSDLTALYLNCSITRNKSDSHTQKLMDRSASIMEREGVSVEHAYALEHTIATGMFEDGNPDGITDDWPNIQQKIMAADILVIGSPIWLGEKASVATLAIERMYAHSGRTNDKGQYLYYGKTAGAIVTGNEDGVKHVSRDILYAMQHIGYTIPPQADCGWMGEIGPGPSYGDPIKGSDKLTGYDNEFTHKNATYMTWNLMHCARMLKDAGGYPAQGNTAESWKNVSNALPK